MFFVKSNMGQIRNKIETSPQRSPWRELPSVSWGEAEGSQALLQSVRKSEKELRGNRTLIKQSERSHQYPADEGQSPDVLFDLCGFLKNQEILFC